MIDWPHKMKTMGRVILITVVLPSFLSGCSGYRLVRTVDSMPMKPTVDSINQTQPLKVDHQSTLSAIEDFLERTSDFRMEKVAVSQDSQFSDLQSRIDDYNSTVNSAYRSQTQTRGNPPTDHQRFTRGMTVANSQVRLQNQPQTDTLLALPIVQSMAISITTSIEPSHVEYKEVNTSNHALEVKPETEVVSLDRFVSQLESKVSKGHDFESEWQLRLMHLLTGRDDRALSISNSISEGTQSLFRSLINVSIAVRDILRNPSINSENVLSKVDELRHIIAEHSDPLISTVALCRKVTTYGVYEEMNQEDLIAGRNTQTIVYSEIENFSSESTSDGLYETRLGTRLELLSADGQSVWHKEEPEIVDRCRRKREDFFIAQRVTFPPTLQAGRYVLKVMIEDKLSGKVSEAIHPIEINAPTSIARNQ